MINDNVHAHTPTTHYSVQDRDHDCPLTHVGTDGTGQSIVSQLPTLEQDGWDVWTLYLPVEERSGWDELTARTAELVHSLATGWREGRGNQGGPSASGNNHHDDGAIRQSSTPPPLVTLVGESFGGCLALRVALFDPALVERLVLINPATCFNRSADVHIVVGCAPGCDMCTCRL